MRFWNVPAARTKPPNQQFAAQLANKIYKRDLKSTLPTIVAVNCVDMLYVLLFNHMVFYIAELTRE